MHNNLDFKRRTGMGLLPMLGVLVVSACGGGGGGNTPPVNTPSNSAPVAVADSYTVATPGGSISPAAPGVLANDTDANNDPLTAALVSNVSNGTLTLNTNGSFTYTHNGGSSTSDSFTYRANDGTADSNTVTVTISITQPAPGSSNWDQMIWDQDNWG